MSPSDLVLDPVKVQGRRCVTCVSSSGRELLLLLLLLLLQVVVELLPFW